MRVPYLAHGPLPCLTYCQRAVPLLRLAPLLQRPHRHVEPCLLEYCRLRSQYFYRVAVVVVMLGRTTCSLCFSPVIYHQGVSLSSLCDASGAT